MSNIFWPLESKYYHRICFMSVEFLRTQHETWAIIFQIDTFSDAMPNQRHTTLISSSRFFRTLTIFPDILVLNQISLAPCGLKYITASDTYTNSTRCSNYYHLLFVSPHSNLGCYNFFFTRQTLIGGFLEACCLCYIAVVMVTVLPVSPDSIVSLMCSVSGLSLLWQEVYKFLWQRETPISKRVIVASLLSTVLVFAGTIILSFKVTWTKIAFVLRPCCSHCYLSLIYV